MWNYEITSLRKYPDVICGAAIPIIGAVAGAAGTVANISAQQKQAQAQQDAIDSQKRAIESNTNLRLIDLERQKLYVQYLAQIDEARRAQIKQQDDAELQTARLKDDLQYSLANQQNEQQFRLGQQQNQNMMGRAQMQNQNAFDVGNAQLRNQYQIGSDMANVDFAGQQAGLDLDLSALMGNADIQQGNQFLQSLGIDQAAAEAQFQKQSEAFGVEGQALGQGTKTLMDVAQLFTNQRKQGKANEKNRAAVRAQMGAVGGGAGSRSQEALLAGDFEAELDDFVDNILKGGQAAELAMSQVGLSQEQADILRQLGSILGGSLSSQAQFARDTAVSQSNLAKVQGKNRYQTLASDLAYRKKLGDLDMRDKYVLGQLALSDEYSLSNISNQEQYTLNQLAMQSTLANNRLNIGDSYQLNKIGFDTYQSARDVQFGIEQAQSELQKQFYDTSLSSSATTIKSNAASELAALRAARNSISSPGLLSYVGAGLGAYQSISGAIPRQQSQAVAPNEFGFSRSSMNFTPGSFYGGQSYTGAPSYGLLSGYSLGGGY